MDQSDSRKTTRLDKQFSDRKEEIRQVYCVRGKPLRETMDFFEHQCGLKASMRKWKSKLKDWGFEKYSKAEEMTFIASKMQSRTAEGKDTAFFVGGRQVTKETLENFMRRKKVDAERVRSPTTTDTPTNISYCTPEPEDSDGDKVIKNIIGELIKSGHKLRVRNYFPLTKIYLSDQAETLINASYLEKSEVEEIVIKIAEERKRKKMKPIKEILEDVEVRDSCVIFPIQAHDNSTMPLLLKVDGETKILDASQEDEPDQGTMDMIAKFGHSSWKSFRKAILLTTRCTQDTKKPPLFPKQVSTIMPPHEASHSPEATGGGDCQEQFTTLDTTKLTTNRIPPKAEVTLYVWKSSKDGENPAESFADPLHQNHGTDDAQKPKDHSFFRFPLGEGNVFQIIPESDAQLVPPEDVGCFIGLQDRNLDVAEQVTSAIGILNSTAPEQDHLQLDHSARLDDLALDLEAIGGEHETGEQDIGDHDEEDQEMEDVSSNPVGVTYTESCMTGISWDYSALFP
ncbi:hypothetical protein V8E51_009720 [Hyaloscypha variabilis]